MTDLLFSPSFRSVKAKNGKTLAPTQTEVFGWPQRTGKEVAVSEGSTVYLHFKCKSNTLIHPFLDDQLM